MKMNHRRALLCGVLGLVLAGCDGGIPPSGSATSQTDQGGAEDAAPISTKAKNKPLWPYLKHDDNSTVGFDQMLRHNFYVVFDGSGSMKAKGCSGGERKMEAAKKALIEFARIVPKEDSLGLIAFDNHGVNELVKLGDGSRETFEQQVESLTAGGNTPLNTTIKYAYDRLTEQARKQLGYGEYHLVVVTDGDASIGENPENTIDKILSASPVVIHTVGFCIDSRHSLNQPGRTIYRSATNYESLKQSLTSVLAEAPDFTVTDFK